MTHGEERRASGMAVLIKLMKEQKAIQLQTRRTMEEHMGRVTRRMEAIERRIEGLEKKSDTLEAPVLSNLPQHQPPQQEEVLLSQCQTVEELEELGVWPNQRERTKCLFLETFPGKPGWGESGGRRSAHVTPGGYKSGPGGVQPEGEEGKKGLPGPGPVQSYYRGLHAELLANKGC
ncbi:uncharacterized protein PAE49_013618 isoform 1-T2 [Odontesthes bonariensis]